MIIDIKVPQGWQQLDDKQLRFVYRLLNQNVGIYELQALCLFKWAKMKVIRKEGTNRRLNVTEKREQYTS